MKEKLLRLIYNYSINEKTVDIDYIKQLVDIIVSYKQLDQYLLKLEFIQKLICEEEYAPAALYNPTTKRIRVYIDNIDKILQENDIEYSFSNKFESIFCRNLIVTRVILRELEYASHQKIINSENNIESSILKLCYKIKNQDLSNNTMYEQLLKRGFTSSEIISYMKNKKRILNNDYIPHLRLTEIKSYCQVDSIIQPIESDIPYLALWEKTRYLSSMISGYEDENGIIISPTIKYLKNSDFEGELIHFSWYDEQYIKMLNKCALMYNLNDRLQYGLPISKEEYHDIKEDIQYKISKLK